MSVSTPRQTFCSPTIPFSGTILGGLQPGEVVLVQGSVPRDADRFQVDLTCGSSVTPRADVAFHFNPRFRKPPSVVCNALLAGSWGREEVLQCNPFTTGGAFELLILVLKDSFKVALNGGHVLEFQQRVDLQRVDTLSISGRVQVQAAGILPHLRDVSPVASSTNQEPPEKKQEVPQTLIISSLADLRIPFSGELAGGLRAGRSISITGETNRLAQSFSVNLRVSGCSDIALHLNPRLKKAVFVRNSFLCGCWGPEETRLDAAFPFRGGQYFEMIILCEVQQFRVAVNGLHQLDYQHRVQDLSRIQQLEVQGDVTLLGLQVL
ncbi:galectin-8-like [Clinocottus analis]|uniref:galectin-8-like n=1 Tax=Clinocottus analis TaxID=304258 RepID=UPI0035C0E609